MRLWIKDPLAILAPEAERGVVVEGAEIVECVGRGETPAAPFGATFDASRHVVLPGLVNTHHHFYQTLTRAHPAGFGKELIPWLVAMERVWDRMTPEALRIAARMALVELLLSGCTTAADHHNLFPPGLENAIDIEVEEAKALGLRMTVTRGSMGISEKDGGLQPDSIVQDSDAILQDSERVLKLFHDPRPGAMIRVALAPCSPLAVPQRVMTESAEARRTLRRPASLPPLPVARRGRLRRAGVRQALGRPPRRRGLDWPADLGRAWHSFQRRGNRPTRPRRRRRVPTAPPADMAFGIGVCPTLDLEAAGMPVGLGVDGSASNDSSNMMEAVRHSLMLARLRYGPAAITPLDALRWATEGSARCLGRDDIGASRRECRRTSRSTGWTSRASAARRTRSPHSRSAAPIAPTASWSPAAGASSTARRRESTSRR